MVNGAAYSSFESFGKYVTAGEKIVVYVDADPNGKLPQLCFGQVGKGKGDWRRWVNLTPGRNEITVPENINPSAIYLVNQATSKEQAFAPRVRVEGGTKFPTYYHGETNPQEFRKELEEFAKKVNIDDTAFENGHPTDSVYNIAEFVSKNVVITTTALGAIKGLEWAEKQDLDISDTMNEWEKMYDMFQTFMGLEKDAEEEKDSYFPNKFVARVFQGVPLGFADHGYTGYLGSANAERDGGFFSMIAAPPNMKGNDNWCYTHEFGHIFNTKYVVDGEVTNNLYAQEYRRINADKGINENRANWDEIFKRFKDEEVEYSMHYFERLAVLSQLNIAYGYDAYAKASKAVRDNTDLIKSIKGNDVQRLAVAYSLGLNVDLLDFFKGWNYANIEITEQMRDAVKDLPKLDKKIEYLHGGAYDYNGNGFTEDIKVNVNSNLNREENTITLNLSVDKNNQDDVLGYEVLKDGKVIGFTKTNSFTINNVNVDENVNYSVIAYAKDLSTAKEVEAQVLKPTLSIEENLTLQIGDKFDGTKYVSATDYEGNSIENIEIEGSVDTSQKGEYKVKYTVTNSNITVEKTMNVKVVSKVTYASDVEQVSAKVGWGSFRKDKAPNNTPIELDRQGLVAGYTKGLGTHANSEVVYNVENYDKFESYIGIDQSMRNNSSSSAKFIIYADGEKVFESGKFGSNTDHEFVSIDLNGVSELKLVTDSLGNNSADQTVWADAKFINNNTKPEIVANNSEYELGSKIDFMENVIAKDIEDGDLTSSIQIVSNNFEENKIGRFEVVYKVSDSDGNESQKSRYITVYETFDVKKSKYDSFANLAQYNETFKIPVASIKNNAGNYGNSVISNAIDNNINTHWETNSPNNNNFKNEVVFDLGETNEISKMSYAARRGGKGFATAFSIYVSNEAEGNDFILAGKGAYTGNTNDVVEFDINDTTARRVKFVFDSARENWASMGEMSFYKKDVIADKVASMFTDSNKNEVTESYDTLDEIKSLREEAKNHPAYDLLKADFDKAEEIVKLSFPTLNIPKSQSVKLGQAIDNLKGEFSATDTKDGDITSKVVVSGIENVNFNKTGEYELTYSITDSDNNTVTKTRKISVVDMNDFKYLSDYNWKSANTGWGNINKDNSVSSNGLRLSDENGQLVSFEKGIGTHATSTIVYDLSDKNYARFTSYVGVDRAMYNSPGSIQFEVYVDGELVFDSKVMNAKDAMKFVDVDITDAKELKLVVKDGGNGNGSDHANWADAKMHFANNEGIEINKSTLDALVEELSNLNENLYTSESVDVVKATLEEVKASLNDGYNQSEIDSLVEKLTEAKNNLEIVIDKSELQQVIEYAKGLDISMVGASNHVEARWSNLLEAIDMANDCLQGESKTQEDIDNAKIYLNYCISELYLK